MIESIRKNAIVLLLASVMTVFMLSGDAIADWLEFQRTPVLDGEWWRLVTGHFIHIDIPHLVLNLCGLGLVWVLGYDRLPPRRLLGAALLCPVFISLTLLALNPGIEWYRGFSGVLHGLFVLTACHYLKTQPRFASLLLLVMVAKLTIEQLDIPLPWQESALSFAVITDAHLYGAIGGALMYALLLVRSKSLA